MNQKAIKKLGWNEVKDVVFCLHCLSSYPINRSKFLNPKNNNLDEIDCEAVQVSNNGMQYVDNEIYKKMKPKYLLMSIPLNSNKDEAKNYINNLRNYLNSKEMYLSNEGDITLLIW